MDPNAQYGNTGQTVQDQINQLRQQREQLTQQANQVEALLPQVSEQDWIIYRDRWLTLGEQNAVEWLINRYGQNTTVGNP